MIGSGSVTVYGAASGVRQTAMMEVSHRLLTEIDGAEVLDPYGRILTFEAEIEPHTALFKVRYREATLLERLRYALRPRR